jgi:hypothetical protein
MKESSKYLLILAILPMVFMAYLMQKFALNIAHWDDHAVRYSIKNVLESNTFIDKFYFIFKQHNEHRIVTTRLIALLSNIVLGYIDYRFLMAFGFLFLICIVLIIKRLEFSNLMILISCLLIFHPAFYENSFWAMAAVQNFGVVFFAILTTYFISKDNIKLAILVAMFSIFTSGNGIIILIAVACNYLVDKNWKKAGIWLIASIVILSMYYFHYVVIEDVVKTDFKNIYLIQKGFVSIAGSWIDSFAIFSSKRLIINYLSGFLNLLIAAFFIFKNIRNQNENKQDIFVFIVYLFVLGTMAATTISRLGYGIETLIGSKYKIYSFLLLLLNFYSLISLFPKLKLQIFIASIFINCSSYVLENQQLVFQKNDRIAESLNASESKTFNYQLYNNQFSSVSINRVFDKKKSLIEKIEERDEKYYLFLKGLKIGQLSIFGIYNKEKVVCFPIDFRTNSIRQFLVNEDKPIVVIPKNTIQTTDYQTILVDFNKTHEGENLNLKGISQPNIKQNW